MFIMDIQFIIITGLLIQISAHALDESTIYSKCSKELSTITCRDFIPVVIPDGIAEVYIKGFTSHTSTLTQQTFGHSSWKHVTLFDLSVNTDAEFDIFPGKLFTACESLKYLGIHSFSMEALDPYAFLGLNKMTTLDLSGCSYLDTRMALSTLDRALNIPNQLPALRTLNLRYTTVSDSRIFRVSRTFANILLEHNITTLLFKGQTLVFEGVSDMSDLPIRHLELTDVTLVHLRDVKHTFTFIRLFSNVVKINYTFTSPRQIPLKTPSNQTRNMSAEPAKLFSYMFEYGRELYLNGLGIVQTINNVSLYFESISLRVLQFKACGIEVFNMTIHVSSQSTLMDLNLLKNNMTYFYLHGNVKLSTLNLGHNKLHRMSGKSEFRDIFNDLVELTELDLSYNNLKNIPADMFLQNGGLRILKLNNNILKSIDFKVAQLKYLDIFDLSSNRIKLLEPHIVRSLEFSTDLLVNHSRQINFLGNPIECSCKSVYFISWIYRQGSPVLTEPYKCTLEGKQRLVNDNSIAESRYLCIKYTVIGASTTVSILVLVVGISLTILIRRWRNRNAYQERKTRFLVNFQNRLTVERFLAMISHSVFDGDEVHDYVLPSLEDGLKEYVDPGFSLVCLGEKDFRPGMAVVNEIHRCVHESSVMIFLISTSFCESSWCRNEIQEAYAQNKPILLLFKEQVDEEFMTPLMKSIFMRNCRAKVTIENGEYKVVPDWDVLCGSVIELAVINKDK